MPDTEFPDTSKLASELPALWSFIQLYMQNDNWLATGTCYGLPQVCTRRVYSKLKYDTQALDRDADQMGDCNKFYKTCSKNNLTGRILVLWCTHFICLGFHSIPVIIYDFACQLAPYCFVREARYFQNTQFLIDEMHAHNHSHCGKACFASNVIAAECGNKGMKRIHKSVSFMAYDHAMQCTKVFLDIWNHNAIL
ncbi:hypothetical protein BDN67DRAFT_991116 [Paxillus ammoniavirescens]|nr:hypothetical protein BDN67DRAFT_991116 [Paxillus ammoniavirescens]